MTTNTAYVGIDPGAGGGICLLRERKVELWAMPGSTHDLWELVRNLSDEYWPLHAYLEKVSGYIGNAHPGSRMFTFGQGYGHLEMSLVAARVPFEPISPLRWQKGLRIPHRQGKSPVEESRASFKKRLKEKAQALFPREKVTLATCDALLIAEYCRRVKEGEL